MKPVKLIIEGINSFDAPQTLDFEAVGRNNLFCISGKTGAGKTTIFDSLMLALYGKSGKGNLADVVNLSRTQAKVTLDFTEGGEMYTVERTIKCKAERGSAEKRSATTDCMLYKNGAPIAKGGEEVTAYIKEIIGLEAGEFKNVYLLEQGEYADFLKKTPSEQNIAVGKIFSLMRFGDVNKLAGERRREQESEAETQTKIIESLGDVSPDKLHDEKTALSSLKAKTTSLNKEAEIKRAELKELEKAREKYIAVREKQNAVKNLMLQSDDAKKTLYQANARYEEFERTVDNSITDKLGELHEQLNGLSALNAIDKEYAAAVGAVELKTAVSEQKRKQAEIEEERYKKLATQCEDDKRAFYAECKTFADVVHQIQDRSAVLQAAEEKMSAQAVRLSEVADVAFSLEKEKTAYDALTSELKNKQEQYAQKAEACERILKVIEKYSTELRQIDEEKKKAEKAEQSALSALSAAQLCSHAAAVRAELHDGDACPVCGGTYRSGGDAEDSDVEKRKAEHEQAEKALKEITEKQAECSKLLDRNKNDFSHEDSEKNRIEREITLTKEKIEQTHVVPNVYEILLEIIENAKKVAKKANESAEKSISLQPTIAKLKAEEEAAKSAVEEAKNAVENYKAELGENCGKTDEKIKEVKVEIESLEKAISETEQKRKQLIGELDKAKAAAAAVEISLAAAREDCPVDIPQFDEEKFTETQEAVERLTKHITENEKDIAVKETEINTLAENCKKLANCEAERSVYYKRAKLYETIAELTKGKAMLNYVAAEYIAEFTAIASEILSELSGGKYTMSYHEKDGFVVSDFLNGGKSRKTDTLSGGELFLASLSVAIAIARTQSNGNNAFFFLDEGFGTLDEDLIDTVYGALESLSSDCLVGVITHAEALISRMPSCVEVIEATDTTGSIIKY
ncbi:MAG: SMC family ATPase [Clostridiales bacterium]|nr:SMC family ATPase [Clostridiales bacterium]